ncbi:hypothetical protein CTM97_21710 [Photobacterium phosphoreum]|uniref:Uncharacterized protein n=1 Tax=Photobacterium phosphoreum TaxID=659 RepID=A0A2T3J9X1_PHOPO|nr:hypothetical protein [Photobacterium phosphoreum]PSU19597.1 hypothetical protein CTM96_20895 [Photobacterium phosphoreum]PSU34519.1 hypothetical protein CTM97_21710 [Photobacterium phosphoreum]PSU45597.1 hypothetical protein C9J18_21670 [Photobacterium phosphoreum]
MTKSLYETLKLKYKTNTAIGCIFNVTRQSVSHWKVNGIPENIALLCHLSPQIQYKYNPIDFGRVNKGLKLNLETTKKVTTNDSIKRVRNADVNHDSCAP